MAQLDLYIDTFGRKLVTGPNNPAPFTLPNLTQGDTISLRVYLLLRTTNYPNGTIGYPPFSIVPVGPLSLKLAIGDKSGTGTGNLIAAQYVWSKAADGTYFYANLALNTTELNTALGTSDALSTKWLEVQFVQAGLPTTCLQQKVTIDADVIKDVSTVPLPNQTATTAEYVNATFLKKDGENDVADFKIWVNAATGKKVRQYVDDDGEMRFEKIQ